MGADQGDADGSGDQRFERGIDCRLADAAETAALQVGDWRHELEPGQGAEGEDVIGIATTIGVVTAGHDRPLRHLR
jgi:hypothetical protein